MTYLAHTKNLKIKAFYAKHTRMLEEQAEEFFSEHPNCTIVLWIAKIRLDNQGKPHFFLLIGYKEEVLKNAV